MGRSGNLIQTIPFLLLKRIRYENNLEILNQHYLVKSRG